jgi:hypothetical protein
VSGGEDEVRRRAEEELNVHQVQVSAFRAGTGKVPDVWRQSYEKLLAPFEAEWKRTKNPLWVWRALRVAFRGPERDVHVLPKWITDYLDAVAWRISALGIGQDHRGATLPVGLRVPKPGPMLRRGYGSKKRKRQAATDLLPDALGFTQGRRAGSSAFSKDARDQEQAEIIARFRALTAQGMTDKDARAALLREQNRDDDRQLRRVLKRGG